jgi:hypothetical protein
MSSRLLFNIAGGIFLLIPAGHTQMYLEVLAPGLNAPGASPAVYASKVSWNQANGYFITSGNHIVFSDLCLGADYPAALLCFKWASQGIPEGLEKYIFGVLLATHCLTSLMYIRKSMPGPPLVYLSTSLLMGIAALKGK